MKLLYKKGGLKEVCRGVKDKIYFDIRNMKRDLHAKAIQKRKLEIGGHHVYFHIHSYESLFRSKGHGEEAVLVDFINNIEASDIIWDVGANHGTYSMFASKIGEEVHAFEPGPEARDSLQKHLSENDLSINIHPIALGEANSEMVLEQSSRSGTRSLTGSGSGDLVKVRRGDELNIPKPNVIKIDVEGFELEVLSGLNKSLDNCRICYVEAHSEQLRKEIRKILAGHGFTLTELEAGSEVMVCGKKED